MARNDGDESYEKLVFAIYTREERPLVIGSEADSGLFTLPLTFNRSGYYHDTYGTLNYRESYGNYWESKIDRRLHAQEMHFNKNVFFTTYQYYEQTKGQSVRWGAKIGDATDSICPKGWEMARSSEDGSYDSLLVQVYSKIISGTVTNVNNIVGDLLNRPLSFVRSGRINFTNGQLSRRGNDEGDGRFWESSISTNTSAQQLGYSSNYFTSRSGNGKGYGFSVRWGDKLATQRRE